jgi:hypothetical protein
MLQMNELTLESMVKYTIRILLSLLLLLLTLMIGCRAQEEFNPDRPLEIGATSKTRAVVILSSSTTAYGQGLLRWNDEAIEQNSYAAMFSK